MKLDELDAACITAAMFNLPEPEGDSDVEAMENKIMEEFGVDLFTLARIYGRLLPLCSEGVSPLTGNTYKGFAKDGVFIAKVQVPSKSRC